MIEFIDYPHQTETLRVIDQFNGRNLVALDPGLGKTSISLRWAKKHNAWPCVVVCPATVKYNWESEALHFIDVRASMCESQTPPRLVRGFSTRPQLVIINYDILQYWKEYITELNPKTFILDECQYLSNPGTYRTESMQELAPNAEHILALSGTPLTNRPIELWPILNLLWPAEFPSRWSFAQNYCNPRYTPWGWDFTGSSNLDQLHHLLLEKGMVRFRKEDVLKDLPPKNWNTLPLQLSDPGEYHEANTDFLNWMKRTMAHKARKAAKAEKVTKVSYLLQLIARLKLRGVVDWANNFLAENPQDKLIMFAIHQKALRVLERRIEAKSVTVDGNVVGRDRQSVIDQFQKDPKTRVFIGSTAAGVGINLTAASDIGIAQFPWRPGDLTQWVGRAHRIGQTRTVNANYLVAADTIEVDQCRLLYRKQKTLSAVLDGGDTPENISIYDELLRVIEGRLI